MKATKAAKKAKGVDESKQAQHDDADADAEPMQEEEAGSPAAAAPAPAAGAAVFVPDAVADEEKEEEEEEEEKEEDAMQDDEVPAAPAPAAAATTTTPNLDAAPTSAPAAAPAPPPPAALSPPERASLFSLWEAEAAELAAAFSARLPLTPWPSNSSSSPRLASQGAPTPLELAPFLVGRGEPLSELSARVCAALGGENPESEAGIGAKETLLSVDVVKSEILALAKRSLVGCSSLHDAEAASKLSGGSSLEDSTEGRLWHWELREPRKCPSKFKAAAAR